ncbi:hypothetical protein [Aestuariivirga sp.]|uniref:hypothetical protein n=1 Tax=Aestuariivirga sp. TaxID=2650926 RepID=UPI0025C626E1|nr:hypothetical protein [Aestuariivirga sp.]MCA3555742.1 hypothetical protein [Aestuariivirga sp.]
MRDMQHIAKVVREALASDFDKVKIIDVRVHDEVGSDGDAVLRVEVIFEGTRKNIDAGKLTGAVRHVRPKLRDIGEDAFPLFSFISKGDWGAGRLKSA